MKKLILAVCFILCSFSSFAAVDCSDPKSKYTILFGILGTYTCGTSETPGTLCYGQAHGTITGVNNCTHTTGVPINSGLTFLIIAGVGIGSYVAMKTSKSKVVVPA